MGALDPRLGPFEQGRIHRECGLLAAKAAVGFARKVGRDQLLDVGVGHEPGNDSLVLVHALQPFPAFAVKTT